MVSVLDKNIYQVWYQGCNNIPNEKFKINIASWKQFNPEWKYHCIDDNDMREACKNFSKECLDAYDKTKNMHTRIDLGRLVLLYLNGGIYVDMDMYALRPLSYSKQINDLISQTEKPHVLGLSMINLYMFEHYIMNQKSTSFNNASVVSSKGNPIIKELVEYYIGLIMKLDVTNGGFEYVNKTTGPRNFNLMIDSLSRKYKDSVYIEHLNYDVLEPCDANGVCHVSDNTISLHNFELSWIYPWMRSCIKLYIGNRILVFIIVFLIMWLVWKYLKT
jgi:mannosyltransferase OCH1-like enzyme